MKNTSFLLFKGMCLLRFSHSVDIFRLISCDFSFESIDALNVIGMKNEEPWCEEQQLAREDGEFSLFIVRWFRQLAEDSQRHSFSPQTQTYSNNNLC
jgi:hypothetical protein